MKKFFFVFMLITLLIVSNRVVLGESPLSSIEIPNPLKTTSVIDIIDRIMNFMFLISIPIAMIMLMYAGFIYITSAGDSKKTSTAGQIIMYALIGFCIVLLAKGIVYVVQDVLTGGSGQNNTTTIDTNIDLSAPSTQPNTSISIPGIVPYDPSNNPVAE